MSEEKAKELGVTPMATYVTGALGGVDPSIMGVGPCLLYTSEQVEDFKIQAQEEVKYTLDETSLEEEMEEM